MIIRFFIFVSIIAFLLNLTGCKLVRGSNSIAKSERVYDLIYNNDFVLEEPVKKAKNTEFAIEVQGPKNAIIKVNQQPTEIIRQLRIREVATVENKLLYLKNGKNEKVQEICFQYFPSVLSLSPKSDIQSHSLTLEPDPHQIAYRKILKICSECWESQEECNLSTAKFGQNYDVTYYSHAPLKYIRESYYKPGKFKKANTRIDSLENLRAAVSRFLLVDHPLVLYGHIIEKTITRDDRVDPQNIVIKTPYWLKQTPTKNGQANVEIVENGFYFEEDNASLRKEFAGISMNSIKLQRSEAKLDVTVGDDVERLSLRLPYLQLSSMSVRTRDDQSSQTNYVGEAKNNSSNNDRNSELRHIGGGAFVGALREFSESSISYIAAKNRAKAYLLRPEIYKSVAKIKSMISRHGSGWPFRLKVSNVRLRYLDIRENGSAGEVLLVEFADLLSIPSLETSFIIKDWIPQAEKLAELKPGDVFLADLVMDLVESTRFNFKIQDGICNNDNDGTEDMYLMVKDPPGLTRGGPVSHISLRLHRSKYYLKLTEHHANCRANYSRRYPLFSLSKVY